jgi:hypothetical protein
MNTEGFFPGLKLPVSENYYSSPPRVRFYKQLYHHFTLELRYTGNFTDIVRYTLQCTG